jgi:predicted GH43/DUF377 family glycosyl hydrolase
MIFGDGPFHAVYAVHPHRLLRLSMDGEGPIACALAGSTDWNVGDYPRQFGELRGGAPPQRVGDQYYSICHSVHGTPKNYRYVAAVYRFGASPPFAPTGAPAGILELPNPFGPARTHERLNPAVAEVVYPCGAIHREGRWFVSYGINDERCAVAVVPHPAVEAAVTSALPG